MGGESNLNIYRYKGIDVYYRVGTEDKKVLNHSFDKDIFLKEIPSFRPSKNPIIIDIGAHIGTFSVLCYTRFPSARIFAFEPSVDSFRLLHRTQDSNRIGTLKLFNMALSGSTKNVKLFHNDKSGNWGHSTTKKLSESFETVKAVSLHDVINDHEIEFIDLVKFNCEGAEFEVLLNAPADCIRKIGLGIILYHSDLYSSKDGLDELLSLFKGLNFRIIHIKKSSDRGWLLVWNKRTYPWSYLLYRAILRRLKIHP